MKILYIVICLTCLILFVIGTFKIEYFTITPTQALTPTPTVASTRTPGVTIINETKTPNTPTPVPKFTPTTPRPIVVGQQEQDLINSLIQNNVNAIDKLTVKIAPHDFLELVVMLDYLTKINNVWTWKGPAISTIPTTTDIITDLNGMNVTTLDKVSNVRGITRVELSRLALLGKIVYLNGKWAWNYTTTPLATQLITDLNSWNIKSANDITSNMNTIVSNDTVKDMIANRYLLYVDGKWIWNSTIDPKIYNTQSRSKLLENGALVAIVVVVFFIILFIIWNIIFRNN